MKSFGGVLALLAWVAVAQASDADPAKEHFAAGEFRAGLFWDNVSAMETRVFRFGGLVGIHLKDGIEVGLEQQFIVPPGVAYESRSWGYLRVVPFRGWPINPFVAARAGYYLLPDRNAVGLGAGFGAVMFVDSHFAFDASLFTQGVFLPAGPPQRQTEFDWHLTIFF